MARKERIVFHYNLCTLIHLSTEILCHHNIILALPRNMLLLHAPEAELRQLSSPYSKSTDVNEALQFHLPQ